jgi:hypothetical protein
MVIASIPAVPKGTNEQGPVTPDEESAKRPTKVTRRPFSRPRRRIKSTEVSGGSFPASLVSGPGTPVAGERLQEAEADAESPNEQAGDTRAILTEELLKPVPGRRS